VSSWGTSLHVHGWFWKMDGDTSEQGLLVKIFRKLLCALAAVSRVVLPVCA
jgi:hypothetical protein